jgi:hypothetical protein
MGEWNSKIGKKQVELPHHTFTEMIDDRENSSHNWYGSRKSKNAMCNAETRKLIDFCEKKLSIS